MAASTSMREPVLAPTDEFARLRDGFVSFLTRVRRLSPHTCLLYTSDAADEL